MSSACPSAPDKDNTLWSVYLIFFQVLNESIKKWDSSEDTESLLTIEFLVIYCNMYFHNICCKAEYIMTMFYLLLLWVKFGQVSSLDSFIQPSIFMKPVKNIYVYYYLSLTLYFYIYDLQITNIVRFIIGKNWQMEKQMSSHQNHTNCTLLQITFP